jgi:hypothetical protein
MAKKKKALPRITSRSNDPRPSKDKTFQVIIGTPKASRNKYGYDPEQGIFILRKVLPEGLVSRTISGFYPALSPRIVTLSMFFFSWMWRPSPAAWCLRASWKGSSLMEKESRNDA